MVTKKRIQRKTDEQSKTTKPSDTCFTIMPFGGWFDRYYEEIYKPAIEAAGLTPCRADDIYRPGTIVHDIWSYTQSAKVILADLTGKNPNVFYELGLGHALAKPAILITETIDDVPFDLRALRLIEYNKNSPDWGGILRQKIQNAIREILQTPLEAVLPAFLKVKESRTETAISKHDKEMLEIKQEVSLLRRQLAEVGRYSRFEDSSTEVRRMIQEMVLSGMTEDAILSRVRSIGAPTNWALNQIMRFMKELQYKEELRKRGELRSREDLSIASSESSDTEKAENLSEQGHSVTAQRIDI